MSIDNYVSKVFSLIGTINNPYYFLYRVCHYLNKYVPRSVSAYICKKNKKEYIKNSTPGYSIDTYDGSGQAVHPDITFWQGEYWLVITPYPYGMEEYENPCIYNGKSLESLIGPKGPIAIQSKHTAGVHLSDPCLAKKSDTLYCFYRESERCIDGEQQRIWEMKYQKRSNSWSSPQMIMTSSDDKILSPAMHYDDNGTLYVFYVSTLNRTFSLVRETIGTNERFVESLDINGMPDGWDLWHIGITKLMDIDESCHDKKILCGLFLVQSKQKGKGMRLFQTTSSNWGREWDVVREIKAPQEFKDTILFPYKSCFIPKMKDKIMLSFRDGKSRNRLIIIDINNA